MNTIIISGTELVTSSAAEEARKVRDELLAKAKALPLVVDAASAALATGTLRDLRDFYKLIEAGRETAKAPVLELGRRIDGFAAELRDAVQAEGERIGKVLGAWNLEQQKIAEEKRQEAIREERRIRQEAEAKERAEAARQEALRQQALREVQRQKDEIAAAAEAKASRARTEAGAERARLEAARAAAAVEAAAHLARIEAEHTAQLAQEARDAEEVRRVAETRQAAALAVATAKPKGTATREDVEYEITDMEALHEAAPYLVKMTENVSALKSALRAMRRDQQLPGVNHWFVASTTTRG